MLVIDCLTNIRVNRACIALFSPVYYTKGEAMEIQPKDTSRGHFYVSLVKSIVRIGAGSCLIIGNLFFAGFLLIFAEILGIVEEMV